MALSTNTVWEVRTAGNDTNGGGFVTGAAGVDYSQQDAKRTAGDVTNISTTDGVGTGVSTFTSATANFTTDIVGNIVYLQGGTGTLAAGWYQVTARASANSITLDRGVAIGTGITLNIGGALLSPGIAGQVSATGHRIFIKAGTYTITSATINVAGGTFSSSSGNRYVEGYETTRGDYGAKPLLQASGISTFTLISCTGSGNSLITNLELDCAGLASGKGLLIVFGLVYKLIGRNATQNAFSGSSSSGRFIDCLATGCSTLPAFSGGSFFGCVAHSNTVTGFTTGGGVGQSIVNCLSYNNTGATTDGFVLASTTTSCTNCTAYANGRDGFRTSAPDVHMGNCLAESNVGVGFNFVTLPTALLIHCAVFGNGTDVSLGSGVYTFSYGLVTGTGSFFTNAAAGDFSLNDTAGAGLAARAAGSPGIFPDGLTTSYPDIGAAQHLDAGVGGGGGLKIAGHAGLAG